MKDKKPNYFKIVWTTALVLLLVLLIYSAFVGTGSYGKKISIDEFESMIENGTEISDIYFYNGIYRIRKKNSEIQDSQFPSYSDYYCEVATSSSVERITNALNGKDINYIEEQVKPSFLSSVMPYLSLAIVLIIGYFLLRAVMRGNAGTMSFGKSKARTKAYVGVVFRRMDHDIDEEER